MINRKGIILAGGSGTRLYPMTKVLSKQLFPIYDKPMIFYPLSVLMLSGIREILIITTGDQQTFFKRLLGDGKQWGVKLSYITQHSPDGLAQAYILGEEFLDGAPSTMILGDNIFFGRGFAEILQKTSHKSKGATVFGYHVSDPERYGVVNFDHNDEIVSIIEKPKSSKSNFALTGLYFLDGSAPDRAKSVKPSKRGELEIISLLETYLLEKNLEVMKIGRGAAWFDTGTQDSLLEAANFVRTITQRQGLQVGSPDEIAFLQGWISKEELIKRAKLFENNEYGNYLLNLADNYNQ